MAVSILTVLYSTVSSMLAADRSPVLFCVVLSIAVLCCVVPPALDQCWVVYSCVIQCHTGCRVRLSYIVVQCCASVLYYCKVVSSVVHCFTELQSVVKCCTVLEMLIHFCRML